MELCPIMTRGEIVWWCHDGKPFTSVDSPGDHYCKAAGVNGCCKIIDCRRCL